MIPPYLLLLCRAAAPDKFYPLAENTLSGWDTFGTAKWTKKTACSPGLHGDPKRWGVVQTKHFKDFELTLDFKTMNTANTAACFYVAPRRGIGPAYQINIGRGAAGEPVGLYLDQWLHKGDEKDAVRKPREWVRPHPQSARAFRSGSTKIHRRFHPQELTAYLLCSPNCPPPGAEGHNVGSTRRITIERKEQ